MKTILPVFFANKTLKTVKRKLNALTAKKSFLLGRSLPYNNTRLYLKSSIPAVN